MLLGYAMVVGVQQPNKSAITDTPLDWISITTGALLALTILIWI